MKNIDIAELVKQALVDLGVIAKRPAYATMDQWCVISGMSRRSTYRALDAVFSERRSPAHER